ncbi:class II aldolase/adducin family protein [candidate division KSB3 bacterium]|uniref:Class II aldolase/adducin family protein n=1 Tax=candidate division KSB3 bacterium TaxID=2044937 RepID=A0A9D5JW10_9BACT|nr:class II aldolase/adducin family protein [candidate division KSB3 bacterium]MBD3324967.1 class II aldolase/adducin family protein [candidate division KSB3 bacterium]
MNSEATTIHQQKVEIVNVGKMMYERRFIVAGDGNISVRLDENTILATPTALCKGLLSPDHIVKMNLSGEVLAGEYRPSSEIKMHLAAYHTRPDIWAVVHAHPPISTGFAVAGIPLDQLILTEMVVNFGTIPLAPYYPPSTEDLAESVAEQVKCHDAVLMANHGVMTIGPDLYTAYHRLEMVEQFATISLVAHLLGKMNVFSSDQLRVLQALREKAGIGTQNPYHQQCPFPGLDTPANAQAPNLEPGADGRPPSTAHERLLNNSVDMDALVDVITQVVTAVLR